MAVDTKVYFESQTMNEVGRAMKKKCPKCGSIEESKFCTVCGQNLMGEDVVKICPTCGAETTRKFCTFCGTRLDQDNTGKVQNSEETARQQANQREEEEKARLAKQKEEEEKARLAKQREEEEKARLAKQREEEEKARLAKQKEEEEKARLAKQREEEEKARLAKQKEDEEKRRIALQKEKEEEEKREQLRKSLQEKKKYDEALSYMEHADQADNKKVAANFYRKAESLFEQVIGWEDAEDKILECARKAKACEIAVESEHIEKGSTDDTQTVIQVNSAPQATEKPKKEKAPAAEKKSTDGKPKSKAIIAAAIIGLLVIVGIAFAMSQGKSDNNQSASSDVTSDSGSSSGGGSVKAGDLIDADNAPELKWDNGSAILTQYQFEKTESDGDCVNLYFEYSKTGGEDGAFLDDVEIDVFQNGYELDKKVLMTVDAENNAFSEVKPGSTITAATGFILNDASDLTVVMTVYDSDYNSIVERTELTIPADDAKEITGNAHYFEETGEKTIKDGISLTDNSGEVKLTGYKWNEYEGEEMLILYFDYTNLLDKETSMSESDFNVTVFQNGIEQENSGWSTTTAESHFFSKIQKDVTMHCAYSYSVEEKSDIDVKLTCYTDEGEKTEEQTISIK